MSVDVDLGNVFENLKKLAMQNEKTARKAVKAGAEYVAEKLEENTPYEDESKYRSWNEQFQYENESGSDHKEFKHLKDDVHVSVGQNGEATVGYGKDTYWRAHFVETGTMKTGGMVNKAGERIWGKGIEAQHFIENTTKETETDVFNILADEIKKGMGL